MAWIILGELNIALQVTGYLILATFEISLNYSFLISKAEIVIAPMSTWLLSDINIRIVLNGYAKVAFLPMTLEYKMPMSGR